VRRLPALRIFHRSPQVLQHLAVSQDSRELVIEFRLRPGLQVHGLWGHCADTGQWWALATPLEGTAGHRVVIDLPDTAVRLPALETTVDLYLDVEHDVVAGSADADTAAQAPLSVLDNSPARATHARYRLRLGKSVDTRIANLQAVADGGRTIAAYPTKGGFISLALNQELKPFADVHVKRISVRDGVLKLRGRLLTRHGEVLQAELLLKARTSGVRVTEPVDLVADEERARAGYGHRFCDFSTSCDLAPLLADAQVVDDIFDVWFTVRTAQTPEPFDVRVGKTRFVARALTRPGRVQRGDSAAVLTPYYTFKARKTSFQFDRFDTGTLTYLRRLLRRRLLLRLPSPAKPVWLVGERPNRAQDTGFHFFRYLREKHPEIDAYYVIDPSSPDYRNVEPLGHVLAHRSKEHIRAALTAERVIGSHHPDFVYPLRTRRFRHTVRATRIFLQHGVMGTKWMVPNYGKGTSAFETDLFIVSSEREKEYIVEDFGYDPAEVAVTGLSRFDTLLANDVEPRRQLLIMPTWRDWLVDADGYLESEYHQRWSELLHHPRLQQVAEAHGLEIVFCLHPNMARFTELFADAPVRVISQGEVEVQHLLKESAMLVTDYSSVGFDFSFLHRPVAYYQFDREHFLGLRGSHLDLDLELPGPITYTADDLLAEVERAAGRDFVMGSEYVRRADRFLTHRDQQSCERIFEAVISAKRRHTRIKDLAASELPTAGMRRFRRSRVYFPAMRAMFRLLRKLPADRNRVVFESGVGRQYADSPRYVYEELVRRGSGLKKIWAYPGKIHTQDQNTTSVLRLSVSYYYHLGRAKYWVNNQNFPHYVTRRPDGVYLQTWHGTPLKRMLYDLETIHGRDGGYIERVTEASSQWSVLASPSPFATTVMRSAFRYEGPVIELGYPRNDIFFRPDAPAVAASVRRRLGIPADKTVVLYAPTFRDDQGVGNRFSFVLPFDLDRFHEEMGDDVVLLLRMHVLVRWDLKIPPEHASTVLDVSTYPEIQELYLASDVLVTDYSSVFFDFANLRRPMVFFAYDLESYRDNLRGFYLDYDKDLPGPVVTSEDALYDTLQSLDQVAQDYSDRNDDFLARFSPRDDGHAAERVVDHVFGTSGPRD
jgi:CDP-glycerol glycerophosphotransferase